MRRAGPLLLAAALAGAHAGPAAGQGLAERMAATRDGAASFVLPLRADVEVCDHGVRTGDGSLRWGWTRRAPERCSLGEGRVEVERRDGRVTSVDLRPADALPPGAEDLGGVPAAEAVAWLVGLARGGATVDAAEDALAPAALARGVEAWPDLLALARDREIPTDVRERALFWVGQAAADAVTDDLTALARDADEAQGVRDAAVFALSRRPVGEAVPALMDVGTTADEAETRRSALFWLARIDDPRVVPFFEALLTGRPPPG